MPQVKELTRATPHSKTYDVILEDGSIADGVEVYHSYKTLATANVMVTVSEATPTITKRQMNGIAKRLDGRFRLKQEHYRDNPNGTRDYQRAYYIPSDEQIVEEFLRKESAQDLKHLIDNP